MWRRNSSSNHLFGRYTNILPFLASSKINSKIELLLLCNGNISLRCCCWSQFQDEYDVLPLMMCVWWGHITKMVRALYGNSSSFQSRVISKMAPAEAKLKLTTTLTSPLCTIFTILPTLWNSEQKNRLLIKLFCLSLDFDETWWNCSTHG